MKSKKDKCYRENARFAGKQECKRVFSWIPPPSPFTDATWQHFHITAAHKTSRKTEEIKTLQLAYLKWALESYIVSLLLRSEFLLIHLHIKLTTAWILWTYRLQTLDKRVGHNPGSSKEDSTFLLFVPLPIFQQHFRLSINDITSPRVEEFLKNIKLFWKVLHIYCIYIQPLEIKTF